jgi:Protein of unknown function (DUF3710)
VRFGRKGGASESQPSEGGTAGEGGILDLPGVGPFDESQVDVDEYLEKHEGIDLGSLIVVPEEGMELRLEVDETSGEVGAALLVADDGALELRAFAASRGDDTWAELRPQIAAEVARIGGTATEQQGSFGTELVCRVPAQTPEGQGSTQTSRVIGEVGPAWILRATLMGAAVLDPALADHWEESIRRVVVRRGREARAPGSPLPLRLPPEARRLD